jgi:hypothetical protein
MEDEIQFLDEYDIEIEGEKFEDKSIIENLKK